MPSYTITALMTVSCSLTVEAASADKALNLAKATPAAEWDVEKDGEPSDFTVEEAS